MALHITNGSCAAELIQEAFQLSSSELLTMNDLLCCGPLSPYNSFDDWVCAREHYWNQQLTLCALETFPMNELPRDFYFHHQELSKESNINIWLGTALGDQMMLAFLVDFFSRTHLDFSNVYIHQFKQLQGCDFEIAGIGMLTPEDLRRYQGQPKQLSQQSISDLRACWQALTSPSPEPLLQFIGNGSIELPELIRALSTLIYRYPDYSTGLTYLQEQILNQVSDQEIQAFKIIGQILRNNVGKLDLVGDLSIFATLKEMADKNLTAPLLKLNRQDGDTHETFVSITQFGEKVLSGETNAVQLNGIDDCVAGTRVSSATHHLWFRQKDSLIKAA